MKKIIKSTKINIFTKVAGTLSLFLFFGFNFASAESVVYLKNSSGILVGKITYERTFVNEYIKINSYCAYKNITEGIGCEYVDENSPLAGAGDNAVRLVSPQNLQNNSGIWGAIGKLSGRVDGLFKAVTGQTPTPIVPQEIVQNIQPIIQNPQGGGSANPVLNSVPVQNIQAQQQTIPSQSQVAQSRSNNDGNNSAQNIVYQVIERAVPGPQGPAGQNGRDGQNLQGGQVLAALFPTTSSGGQYNGYGVNPLQVNNGGPADLTNITSQTIQSTGVVGTNATLTNATVTNFYAANTAFGNLQATNATFTSATTTNLSAANANLTNIVGSTLIENNATITNGTSTNWFVSNILSAMNAIFTNLTATFGNIATLFGNNSNFITSNASTSNATTSNAVTFNGTTGNVGTINSGTGNFGNLNATGTTQLTNVYASTSNASTTNAITGNITNLNNTLATITSATVTDLSVTNFVTPSLNAVNGTITNSTSTNIFSTFANFLSSYITTLFGNSSNFVISNASTSNATTSNAVTFNGTTGNFVTENATTNNSQTSNSSTSNATTSNAVTFNGTTGNVGTINSGTGNFGNLNATGTTQLTNVYASTSNASTTNAITGNITNLNNTLATITSATVTDLSVTNFVTPSLNAVNGTITNSTSTNIFSTFANFLSSYITTLFGNSSNFVISNASTSNATTSNAVTFNGTTGNFVTENATTNNSQTSNSSTSNATTSNAVTFNGTTGNVGTINSGTGNFGNLNATGTTQLTNIYASTSNATTTNAVTGNITNLNVTNGTITNATSTNGFFSNLLSALSAVFTNLVATNLSSTNATFTNATSTNFNISSLLSALTAAFTNLTATNATLTNATATNLYASALAAQNASFTNLTATGYLGVSNGVGTNGQILQTTGTTTQWVSTSSLGISGGADTYSTVSSEGLLVNSAGTQSIPNATYATVTDLTVVTRNDFGASSLSGGVFTVPSGKAGWYQINANYTPNVSNGSVRVHIVVNGTVRHIAGSTGTDNYIDTAFAVYLNAGDIVSISAYQTSGSAQLVYYTTSLSLVRLNFNVYGNSGSSITPSFSVHKNGTNQAGIVVGNQKITWSAKSFDTNTNFDTTTSRYTPTIAGKYLFTTAVESNLAVPATEAWQARIYKNGSSVCDGSTSGSGGGNGASSVATCVLDANGTTDYFEVFLLSSAANSVYGVVSATYFTGSRIDGGSGPFTQASSSFAYSAVSSISIGTSTYQNANSLYVNNGITLANQTASSTTNSLYNNGGTLYWNGTSLSNATGTQGFISYFSTTGSSSVATSSIFISTAGNVGIGNTSPTNKLDITGNLNVADTYAYKYNGANVIRASTTLNNYFFGNSGNLTMTGSNVSAFGHTALLNNTTGSDNSAFGSFALTANTTGLENAANGHGSLNANTTGSYNTANGSQSLFLNTTSNANVANGFQALYNNTAASNTAIGYQSMFTNTTGTTNTANGYQALYSNTTGASTTAVGYQALFSNTTGLRNTGIGDSALYANTIGFSNTAVGSNAMLINTTGDRNTAIGRKALQENTTGVQNTAAGESALIVNTTGTQNSAFGSTVLTSNTTGTFNTGVGYQALVASISGSNNTSVGYFSGASLTTGSNNTFIGYNAQPSAVGVSDEVRIGGTNVTSFRAQVALTVTSDSRFKENIATTSLGLDFLTKLKPVQYTRIADNEHKVEYGFIAQEVLEQLTAFNATNTGLIAESSNASGTPFLSLRYNDFISILTLSVQEVANITGTFKTNLINWLANADNGINKFFAKSIYSQLVCLTDDSTDANPVCVTKAELLQIKSGNSLPGVQTIIPPITSATPTSPVVTMVGSSTMSMTVGEIYIELGATVTDDLDTGLTINISGSVDAALAGTYYVVYSSNPDTQGNLSNTATRTVIVADALVVPPSIIPPTCTASTTLNTITNTCE